MGGGGVVRPLRDDDPPGTRVSVLDRTRGGGRRCPAVVLEHVAGSDPAEVCLRGVTHALARWLDWAGDCLVIEPGDEVPR